MLLEYGGNPQGQAENAGRGETLREGPFISVADGRMRGRLPPAYARPHDSNACTPSLPGFLLWVLQIKLPGPTSRNFR